MVQVSSVASNAVRDVEMNQDGRREKRTRNWIDFPTTMLKWAIFMLCFLAFLANSYQNMTKFKDGATTISEEWVWPQNKKLALPTITLCPLQSANAEKDIRHIEDVVWCPKKKKSCVQRMTTFGNTKRIARVNFSDHKIIHSLDRGVCFTIDLLEIAQQQMLHMIIRDLPLKIYFHEPGEEFFLRFGWFPNGLPAFMTTKHDDQDTYAALLTRTSTEHKDNCKPWTLDNQIECLRSQLRREYNQSGINCTLPWMENILLVNSTFNATTCSEMKDQVVYLLFKKMQLHIGQTCQVPCNLVKYTVLVDNFGSYAGVSAGTKRILLQYETTATKVLKTVDLFSFNDFVSSIGGNLGLFLDFSLISLLFALLAKIIGRSLN